MIVGQSLSVLTMANELGYTTNDVNVMYRSFVALDKYKTGLLLITDLLKHCNITNLKFGVIGLSVFDEGNSGELNFEEFLLACWNLIGMAETETARLIFKLFDDKNVGELTGLEIKELVAIVTGGLKSDSCVALEALHIEKRIGNDHQVSFSEFWDFAKDITVILYPVFQAQECLRRKTLGRERWEVIAADRLSKYGDISVMNVASCLHAKPACTSLKKFSYNHCGFVFRSPAAIKNFNASNERRNMENKVKSIRRPSLDSSKRSTGSVNMRPTKRRSSTASVVTDMRKSLDMTGADQNLLYEEKLSMKNKNRKSKNRVSAEFSDPIHSSLIDPKTDEIYEIKSNITASSSSGEKMAPRRKSLGDVSMGGGGLTRHSADSAWEDVPSELDGYSRHSAKGGKLKTKKRGSNAGLTENINKYSEDKTKDIISNFQEINDPKYQITRADKIKQDASHSSSSLPPTSKGSSPPNRSHNSSPSISKPSSSKKNENLPFKSKIFPISNNLDHK